MGLAPGARLGPYEVVSPLGAGGMGEVYRARDPRLGRDVAVKVLPADRLADPSRRRRFVREARAASALNHPHIVTIHEIDSADGMDFIVMELVSGKTLAELIRNGLRLRDALRIAIAVADALACAHAAGIVHRDLKPANVVVSADGTAKVLDFGLAKLVESDTTGGGSENATATAESAPSRSGTIAGTPGYMSPEQAAGGKVDARTDVFSFGALLYEMVTARRAFAGSSAADTLAQVLAAQPVAPGRLARGIPSDLEKLIVRCLRKEPERRLQHMADVRLLLEEIRDDLARAEAAAGTPTRHRSRWLVAGAVSLVAIGAGVLAWRSRLRLPAPILVPVTAMSGTESFPSLSPDGSQVAFSWEGEAHPAGSVPDRDIWVKLVDGTETRRLTAGSDDDWNPAWSPDGSQIAFLRFPRGTTDEGRAYVVSALGGAERRVGDLTVLFSQLSWSPDGRWLAVGGSVPRPGAAPEASGIHLISLATGESRVVTTPPQPGYDIHPAFAPDGRRLAYASCAFTGRPACEVLVTTLDWSGKPSASGRRLSETVENFPGIAWTRDGRSIVYAQSFSYFSGRGIASRLWRVPADGSLPPERIELAPFGSFAPATTASRDTLLFTLDRSDFDIYGLEPGGSAHPVMANSFLDVNPRFSPDGRRIVFESSRSGDSKNIWTADPDGSNPVELTRPPGVDGSPAWSPDGAHIVFIHDRPGDIWIMGADGASPRRAVEAGGVRYGPPVWSRDGRWLYCRQDRKDGQSVVRIPVAGGPPVPITKTGPLVMVEESPDGRSVFFTRHEDTGALYNVSLETRVEREVEGCVFTRAMASTARAFYFVGCTNDHLAPVYRLDVATGARHLLGKIDREGAVMGLAVSADEKRILYGREVPWNADLVMIDHFR
jgi:serine/threonine protein kinase/Tol biopolymer transport system component